MTTRTITPGHIWVGTCECREWPVLITHRSGKCGLCGSGIHAVKPARKRALKPTCHICGNKVRDGECTRPDTHWSKCKHCGGFVDAGATCTCQKVSTQ